LWASFVRTWLGVDMAADDILGELFTMIADVNLVRV
jgi:hypothetical protein